MSFQESDNHIKEEPEWEDYCISEAQAREAARSGRGVKLEPGSEPPSSITGAPETGCKTGDSINSNSNARKSTDTEKNNNDSVKEEYIKEESEENSWLQQLTDLYEDTDNNDDPKLGLDQLSGTSGNVEINRKSEEPNAEPPVFQKTKVVNTRKDLELINKKRGQEAQEVNQKNISRPVIIKYLVKPRQQPVMPAKTNPVLKKPDVCKEVVINPEIGLLSQPLMAANPVLINDLISISDSVKKQSSTSVPRGYNQTVPLLNSVAYNNCAISTQSPTVPRPGPIRRATKTTQQPLPRGSFQSINGPMSRPLPEGIPRPITLPITQMKGNVSVLSLLKNLPSKTTTSVQNFQTGTISKLQPGAVTKFQPGNIYKLQPGIEPKLQSNTTLAPKTCTPNSQAGPPNVGRANIATLQPVTMPSFKVKIVPTLKPVNPASLKSVMVVTQLFNKPIIGNRFDSDKSNYQKVAGNDKSLVSVNTSTSGSFKTIITDTPASKPTPKVPANYARIAPKPIPKLIYSQTPKAVDRNVIFKNVNCYRQLVTQNNYIRRIAKPIDAQAARQIDSDVILLNDDRRMLTQNSNVQPMAPKTAPKVSGPVNSKISQSIDNYIIRQSVNDDRRLMTQKSNVQPMAPKTVPKVPGPRNSQISKSIDNGITPQVRNYDRQVVTHNLPPNSKDSEPSEKVVNLEDFLKPSYVVIERLKDKTCKGCKNTSYEYKDPAREKPLLNLGNEGAIRIYDDRDTTTRLTCKYCQRGFYKYHLLFLHIQRNHLGIKRREYHCDYCGKICTDKHNLVCHIRIHTGEKPFTCSICNTYYRTESNLLSHNLNIHGRKKHICPICKRPLTWSTNMTRHMSTHFGKHSVDRPHVCLICEKRFIQKHHLTRHLESHSGVRRYVCDICKMGLTRKCHLERHIENIHMKRHKRRVRRVKRVKS